MNQYSNTKKFKMTADKVKFRVIVFNLSLTKILIHKHVKLKKLIHRLPSFLQGEGKIDGFSHSVIVLFSLLSI